MQTKHVITIAAIVTMALIIAITSAYAQTAGTPMHMPTPTLPNPSEDGFVTSINEMMSPARGPSPDKTYEEVVSWAFRDATLGCPDGSTHAVTSNNPHREVNGNYAQHNLGHTPYLVVPRIGDMNFLPIHVDIDKTTGIFHVVGLAENSYYVIQDSPHLCPGYTGEGIYAYDLFGACDGSEAILTLRGDHVWNITATDAQFHAACITG